MAEHTQGWWRAEREGGDEWAVNADGGRWRKHVALARANSDGAAAVGPAEAEANARLIAAAPELLATCRAVLNGFRVHRGRPVMAEEEMRGLLVAAIAQATGQS